MNSKRRTKKRNIDEVGMTVDGHTNSVTASRRQQRIYLQKFEGKDTIESPAVSVASGESFHFTWIPRCMEGRCVVVLPYVELHSCSRWRFLVFGRHFIGACVVQKISKRHNWTRPTTGYSRRIDKTIENTPCYRKCSSGLSRQRICSSRCHLRYLGGKWVAASTLVLIALLILILLRLIRTETSTQPASQIAATEATKQDLSECATYGAIRECIDKWIEL